MISEEMMKIETSKGIIRVRQPSSDVGADDEFYEEKIPLVKFDSHIHPFLMLERYCDNPECDCNEAFLDFVETHETGSPIVNPIQFSIYLDFRTWQENRRPKRSKVTQRLVDDFIDSLTDGMKNRFKDHYERNKGKARNAAKFKMSIDEINSGIMVSYADVFGNTGSVLSGNRGVGFTFEYEGKDYLIEDLYCIAPKCKCEAARLVFLELHREAGVLSDLFDVLLSFNNGLKIGKHPRCTKEWAKKIFSEWQKSDPDAIYVLKDRYREIKEVGRRLVAEDGNKMVPKYSIPVGRNKKIGRNAPCPCGSGRKYKKCCGRYGRMICTQY